MNHILGIGGLLVIIFSLVLVVDISGIKKFEGLVSMWGMVLAYSSTLSATVLSLIYSEIFGFIPCGLCWIERILLYPQVILIGVAVFIKDISMPVYGIVLSSFGLIVSLYHHYLQMGGNEFIPCPASGAGSDCLKRFFFEFNFMTFPLLSTILFVFLIVLYTYILKTNKN
ncbi:MAG: disulfide bond formation protein B [Candidatus Pacebacteria bacterium]|nr:disulfide bond formation protein B [Candidatus Paceibacterota bacterium]MCF7857047.1 disulfide bond formation protein B [Candidatus Paceibacterota bacterium]